ncbi:MAG: hypothetical protein ACI9U2_003482 [Bradymonadia bacterium]|jgi:hypothetical protein
MSQSVPIALIGPHRVSGQAALEALEPLASAITIVAGGVDADAGVELDWHGTQIVAALGTIDFSKVAAVLVAQDAPIPNIAAPILYLSRADVPVLSAQADAPLAARQRLADPVARALSQIISPLAGAIEGIELTVLDSVSTHGRAGMDALRDQTVALLNFRPLPTDVFTERVAFDVRIDAEPDRETQLADDLSELCPSAPRADVRRLVMPAFVGAAVDVRLRGAGLRDIDVRALLADAGCEFDAHRLDDVAETRAVHVARLTQDAAGVRLWALFDDLRWGVGAGVLDFLTRALAGKV